MTTSCPFTYTRTNGWSALGGRTLSAYVPGPLNRSADIPNDTCGSSAGSCVAVSAGLAAASVSTETEGSIICPANRAGLYGLKPSVGIVSRTGVIPISSTQDTAGPTAKSAWDVAAMLEAMAGKDEKDGKSEDRKGPCLRK